jgi:hypothetical protein
MTNMISQEIRQLLVEVLLSQPYKKTSKKLIGKLNTIEHTSLQLSHNRVARYHLGFPENNLIIDKGNIYQIINQHKY